MARSFHYQNVRQYHGIPGNLPNSSATWPRDVIGLNRAQIFARTRATRSHTVTAMFTAWFLLRYPVASWLLSSHKYHIRLRAAVRHDLNVYSQQVVSNRYSEMKLARLSEERLTRRASSCAAWRVCWGPALLPRPGSSSARAAAPRQRSSAEECRQSLSWRRTLRSGGQYRLLAGRIQRGNYACDFRCYQESNLSHELRDELNHWATWLRTSLVLCSFCD